MKVFYDRDANLDTLRERQIAVIGYGSQGFAQSNNLRDSGCNVTVGLRPDSSSRAKAEQSGLLVRPVAQAAAEADIVMMLVSDELAADVYARVLHDCRDVGLQIRPPGRIGHGLGLGVTEPPHISSQDPTRLALGRRKAFQWEINDSQG